jgi:hypothetical protein
MTAKSLSTWTDPLTQASARSPRGHDGRVQVMNRAIAMYWDVAAAQT